MSSLIVEANRIESLEPLPNSDNLEVAKVKGWFSLVGKGQHKVGELVTFLPPDCILPQELVDKYQLTFLKNGRRIRTLKLRNFISQGLILPLPEGNFKEGDSLVDVLKIMKWEPTQSNSNCLGTRNAVSKKKCNSSFTKYTEIENVKNYNNVFSEKDEVVITEKIHGSNFRCGLLKRDARNWFQKLWIRLFGEWEYVYGSHNVQIQNPNRKGYYKENVYLQIFNKYNMKEKLERDTIIYGEIFGGKIQDLTYGLTEIDLKVFDVKKEGKYLNYDELLSYCHFYSLPMVPELYRGRFSEAVLIQCTEGNSILCTNQIREGCVVKSAQEENHYTIGRKILKSINKNYLIRKNGTEGK